MKPSTSSHSTSSSRSGARLPFETVKQAGGLDGVECPVFHVVGHRLNVYLYPRTGPLLQGLPPIVDDGARILISATCPAVMSLALAQQYYGNPRNGFWRITGDIFGFDSSSPYPERSGGAAGRHAVF